MIILVEVAVGLIAILSGFGYKHTYIVSISAMLALYVLTVTHLPPPPNSCYLASLWDFSIS